MPRLTWPLAILAFALLYCGPRAPAETLSYPVTYLAGGTLSQDRQAVAINNVGQVALVENRLVSGTIGVPGWTRDSAFYIYSTYSVNGLSAGFTRISSPVPQPVLEGQVSLWSFTDQGWFLGYQHAAGSDGRKNFIWNGGISRAFPVTWSARFRENHQPPLCLGRDPVQQKLPTDP